MVKYFLNLTVVITYPCVFYKKDTNHRYKLIEVEDPQQVSHIIVGSEVLGKSGCIKTLQDI